MIMLVSLRMIELVYNECLDTQKQIFCHNGQFWTAATILSMLGREVQA